jgi:hypothetical protein
VESGNKPIAACETRNFKTKEKIVKKQVTVKTANLTAKAIDVVIRNFRPDLTLWDMDNVQFPRLIAEINATQERLDLDALSGSMGLELAAIDEIFERAEDEWERIKQVGISPTTNRLLATEIIFQERISLEPEGGMWRATHDGGDVSYLGLDPIVEAMRVYVYGIAGDTVVLQEDQLHGSVANEL